MEELIKELSNALFGTDIHDATVQNAIQYETKFSEADLKRAIKFINKNESNNPHTSISFVVNGEPPASKRPRATNIMKDGKKSLAISLLEQTFEEIKAKGQKKPDEVFAKALENVMPKIEVRPKRVG